MKYFSIGEELGKTENKPTIDSGILNRLVFSIIFCSFLIVTIYRIDDSIETRTSPNFQKLHCDPSMS